MNGGGISIGGQVSATSFASAEDAWFWAVGALRARRDGGGYKGTGTPRPCDPDDVLRCLDRLYHDRCIDIGHARVLRVWGDQQLPPRARRRNFEDTDTKLWREAMERLGPVLRQKGIVRNENAGKKSLTAYGLAK